MKRPLHLRSGAAITHSPFGVVAAIVVLLGCLPVCVALVPFVPYGTTGTSDAALDKYARSRLYGPYSLPSPMLFTDGGRETQYFVSTNGAIMFRQYSDYIGPTYAQASGRLIAAAYGPFVVSWLPNTGMYHRTFSGNESLMRSMWSDVLTSIPFTPTSALVVTMDQMVGVFLQQTSLRCKRLFCGIASAR